jgi:MFS family permease
LIARMMPLQRRGRGFSIATVAQTAGIAIGSIAGGIIMTIAVQATFNSLLILGIASLLVSLVIFIRARLLQVKNKAK